MDTTPPGSQSAGERRTAEAGVRALTARLAPEHPRLIAALRRSLRKRMPTAHEVVYEYRDWFVISFSPSGKGYEGVFAIRGSADGLKLYFNQGSGLPDPHQLLKGAGQTRFIDIETAATLTRPAVVALIDAALDHNRVPFASAGRGSVILRPAPTKKQPARRAKRKTATKKKKGR